MMDPEYFVNQQIQRERISTYMFLWRMQVKPVFPEEYGKLKHKQTKHTHQEILLLSPKKKKKNLTTINI